MIYYDTQLPTDHSGPVIIGQGGYKVFSLQEGDIRTLRRLPQEVREEVSDTVHKYIEQVGKDYPCQPTS